MIKALLSVRFQALLAGLTSQGRQKKKNNTGMLVLLAFVFIYLIIVGCGMMCALFATLAQPYHAQGLDWLYFSTAGLLALGISVFGGVFTTQNQLYAAKDNNMLLAMPITPNAILLSRMIPLLVLNLLFASMVMIPAIVMYAILVSASLGSILLQLASLLGIVFFAQAISCLFGWLLHLLLRRMNKSLASVLFMALFLGIYFGIYSQAGNILQTMTANSQVIAGTLQSWVWPLYAMGMGCTFQPLLCLVFLSICAICFFIVCRLLSATFLRSATGSSHNGKKRKLSITDTKTKSPISAIVQKEWKKFLGSPVYLTNMGLGVILTLALPIAGFIFRDKLTEVFAAMPALQSKIPLLICAILSFACSTSCISTPSVSLEGKNIWILKAMPISSRDILLGKLYFHCILTVPTSMVSGFLLSVIFDCSPLGVLLCTLIPGLLCTLSGLLGLWAGLMWCKLDFISEAYPCKQSISVAVCMFGMMGLPLILGLAYALLLPASSPVAFLTIAASLLIILCFAFWHIVTGWGTRKWESL